MKQNEIGPDTKIPLGGVLSIIVVLLGGMAWLTTVSNKTDAATSKIEETRQEQAEISKSIQKIETQTAVIMNRLDQIERNTRPRH